MTSEQNCFNAGLVEGGLNILRAEASGCRKKDRTWRYHNLLMRKAEQHITACGLYWEDYSASLSREFAELLKL